MFGAIHATGENRFMQRNMGEEYRLVRARTQINQTQSNSMHRNSPNDICRFPHRLHFRCNWNQREQTEEGEGRIQAS